jgi:tetratricopeptide (TPR) repeat protein
MNTRRIVLFWIATLALIAGSQVIANRAPQSGPEVGASPNVEDVLSVPGMKSTDAQIAFWRERIEQAPQDFVSLTYLGQTFLRKARETGDVGDYQRAESALNKAVDLDPDYEFALAYLAAARFAKHDFQGALELATRVYTFDPQALQALATIGDAQLELGNYDAAETAFQQLADRAPSAPAYSRLARLAWLHGHPDQALQLMQQAADDAANGEASPENAAWYQCQLGELEFGTGALQKADSHYAAALQQFPNYYLALAGLGRVRAAEGHYAEAIELYQHAVAIIPQPEFLAGLGDLYSLTNRAGEAEQQYATVEFIGKLAEINQVVYNRQLALFSANHQRNVAEALTLASTELAKRRDVYGYDAAAWALHKNGRDTEAAQAIDDALRLGTRDALLYYHAGLIYAGLGNQQQAYALLTEALAINPNFDPLQAPIARTTLHSLGRQ